MKFDNNGIGKLADAQSCTVTEKRNGSYELKLICPADGIHAEMLEEGNVILAKPSDTMQPQPFRIYKITTPIDGKLEVQARHISYQLNFITVSPFSVSGCAGAVQGLKSHAVRSQFGQMWHPVRCLLCPFRHLSVTVWAVWMVRYWILLEESSSGTATQSSFTEPEVRTTTFISSTAKI